MKYEMPTCEIVLLEQVDCIVISAENKVKDHDTPYIPVV